jgi:hypothetical protein
MKHPYKIYKIVPDIESEVLKIDEKSLIESLQRHLKNITERNKLFIPKDIYKAFLF